MDDDQKMAMAQELGYEKMLRQYRLDRLHHLERECIGKCEFQGRKTILENKRDIENGRIVWPQREERVRSEIEKSITYEIARLRWEEMSAFKDAQRSSRDRRERDSFCKRERNVRSEIAESMASELCSMILERFRERMAIEFTQKERERKQRRNVECDEGYYRKWVHHQDMERSWENLVAQARGEAMLIQRDAVQREERLCRDDVFVNYKQFIRGKDVELKEVAVRQGPTSSAERRKVAGSARCMYPL